MPKQNGTVKWFNYSKGYGFITPDDDPATDILVKIAALNDAGIVRLEEGQRVQFDIDESTKTGKSAVKLTLLQ